MAVRRRGPNLFFLMARRPTHTRSKDPGAHVDAKQPAKFSADFQPAYAARQQLNSALYSTGTANPDLILLVDST